MPAAVVETNACVYGGPSGVACSSAAADGKLRQIPSSCDSSDDTSAKMRASFLCLSACFSVALHALSISAGVASRCSACAAAAANTDDMTRRASVLRNDANVSIHPALTPAAAPAVQSAASVGSPQTIESF